MNILGWIASGCSICCLLGSIHLFFIGDKETARFSSLESSMWFTTAMICFK